MNWIKVNSTRVDQVAFDTNNNRVYVKFKKGITYVYRDVSENTFKRFLSASSIGKSIPLLGKNYARI